MTYKVRMLPKKGGPSVPGKVDVISAFIPKWKRDLQDPSTSPEMRANLRRWIAGAEGVWRDYQVSLGNAQPAAASSDPAPDPVESPSQAAPSSTPSEMIRDPAAYYDKLADTYIEVVRQYVRLRLDPDASRGETEMAQRRMDDIADQLDAFARDYPDYKEGAQDLIDQSKEYYNRHLPNFAYPDHSDADEGSGDSGLSDSEEEVPRTLSESDLGEQLEQMAEIPAHDFKGRLQRLRGDQGGALSELNALLRTADRSREQNARIEELHEILGEMQSEIRALESAHENPTDPTPTASPGSDLTGQGNDREPWRNRDYYQSGDAVRGFEKEPVARLLPAVNGHQKYKPNPHPLKAEKKMRSIQPHSSVMIEKLRQIGQNIDEDQNVGIGFNLRTGQDAYNAAKAQIKDQYAEEFRTWLRGNSGFAERNDLHKVEEVREKVKKQLRDQKEKFGLDPDRAYFNRLPGVAEYLDSFIDVQKEFELIITKLLLRGPKNLNESYIYYKYIVTGEKPTPSDMEEAVKMAARADLPGQGTMNQD